MNKEYYIKLKAKLDDSTKTTTKLNSQIKKMNNKLEKLQLKIDEQKTVSTLNSQIKKLNNKIEKLQIKVDDKKNTKVVNGFNTLNKALKSVGVTSQNFRKNFQQQGEVLRNGTKTIKTYVDSMKNQLQITEQINGKNSTFSAKLTSLNTKFAANANKMSALNAEYKKYDEVQKSLGINLSSTSEGWERINRVVSTNGNIVERWTNNSGKVVNLTSKIVGGQQLWAGSLKEVNKSLSDNSKEANSWRYSWSKAFQSFTTYMSITNMFFHAVRAIKSMISEVYELDKSLTELKKVTDLENEALDDFVNKAYKVADTIAKTGTEMIQAATEFAKAGYKDDDILNLGRVALLYTNIADEEISAADAAEVIIAQMKAFNIEAQDAIHVIDAINEVSNNFAVSSKDIASNLGISSAVMANAGNTFEQMIGLLTAGTEITRSANKVSNGLKTITLRLQGMNDEGERDLELVSKMESLYQKLGITVYRTDGTIKNTYELLGDLASVYGDLTVAEKAFVTETIAGKYQSQIASSILNNWKTAVEATETAINSQNSAMEENQKVMGSVEGHLKKLNNEWESFARSTVSTDVMKFFIDLGTTILKLANSAFGQLTIKMSTWLLLLTGAKTGIAKIISQIKMLAAATLLETKATDKETASLVLNLSANLKLGTAIKVLAAKKILAKNASNAVTAAQISETASTLTLSQAFKALTVSMLSNPLFWGAAAFVAIGALINHLQKVSETTKDATDKLNENAQETVQKYEEAKDKVDELNASLEENKKRIEELERKPDLTYVQKEELLRLQEVTAELEKQISYAKILENIALRKKNQAQMDLIKKDLYDTSEILSYAPADRNIQASLEGKPLPTAPRTPMSEYQVIKATADEYSRYLKTLQEYQSKVSDLQSKIAAEIAAGGDTKALEKELDKAQQYVSEYGKLVDDTKNKLEEYAQKVKEHADSITYIEDATDSADVASNQMKETLEDLYKNLLKVLKPTEVLGVEIKYIADKYSDAYKQILELSKAENLNEESMKALLEEYPELAEYIQKISDIYGLKLIDIIIEINDITHKSKEEIISLTSALKSYSEGIADLQSHYEILTNAVNEFNEQGYITASTFQSIIDNNLLQYLEWTTQGLIANTDELFNNADALKVLALSKLNDAYASDVLAIATGDMSNASDIAKNLINDEKKEIDGLGDLAKAQAGGLYDLAKANDVLTSKLTGGINIADIEDNLKKLNEVYNKYATSIVNTSIGVTRGKYTGSSTSKTTTSSTSSNEKEWWETEYDKLKTQFGYSEITISEYINGLNNILSKLEKGSDAWREINQELQKQRLNKVEDDYKRGTISLQEYIKQLKELALAYKKGSEEWNNLADKIKKGLQDIAEQSKKDLDTAEKAAINIIQKELDKLQELKDEQSEYYDKLIEDKKNANEETERELELARLQEALANAQKERTKRVWREGIGWVNFCPAL